MKKYLLFLIFPFLLMTCKKDDKMDDDIHYPSTPEEIAAWVESNNHIAKAGGEIIEDAIAKAYAANEPVDVEAILGKVKSISGIKSASLTPSGSHISVEKEDGTWLNLQIISPTDDRMFIEGKDAKISTTAGYTPSFMQKAVADCETAPRQTPKFGNKYRMLILAPYQDEFSTDINKVKANAETAGFADFSGGGSEVHINGGANFEKFKGDYMKDFDFVVITGHGGANAPVINGRGKTTSSMGTGTKPDNNAEIKQLKDQNLFELVGTVFGTKYLNRQRYGFTPQFLEKTTTQKDAFKGTHVFLFGCQTSLNKSGKDSFIDIFTQLGAETVSGFDDNTNRDLMNDLLYETLKNLSSCKPLNAAIDSAKKVARAPLYIRLLDGINIAPSTVDANLLYYQPNTSDCYRFCEAPEKIPAPVTDNATDVQWNRATLHGKIPAYGGTPITECGFAFALANAPDDWEDLKDEDFKPANYKSDTETKYSITLPLQYVPAGLKVLFKAYAAIGDKKYYAEEYKSFTTLEGNPPAPVTLDATDIGSDKATLQGKIPGYGGVGITERGFAVTPASDPSNWKNFKDEKFNPATYSSNTDTEYGIVFHGFQSGVEYRFRAYAVASGKEYYDEKYKSFTTVQSGTEKITMTGTGTYMSFTISGPGTATIDWGDGTVKAITFSSYPITYEHTYTTGAPLYTINIVGNNIADFNCSNNQLTSLNVSGATALTNLNCSYNQLTGLNVSDATKLKYLNCYYNQLASLNVSGCSALIGLSCRNNKLTNLDVSGATALATLYCPFNELTGLDVSGLKALGTLDCRSNYMTAMALNNLFRTLDKKTIGLGYIYINSNGPNRDSSGANDCNRDIALSNNWIVSLSNL